MGQKKSRIDQVSFGKSRLTRAALPFSSLADAKISLWLNSDEKVANRTSRVWHGATENGPLTMDTPRTFPVCV